MSIWMKETVPGKKKRPGQDKNIQDLKEENIQRPQVKLNTQPAKRTSSSAGNTGFRFEEWPDEQGSSGKRVVSQTPTPPLPSTREPEYRAKDGLGSTHQWPCFPPWGTGGEELGLDTLGGFLSGLFLSGAKGGYNAAEFSRMGQEALDTGSFQDYISLGLLADHDSEAYQYAQEIRAKLNTGRTVTNIEMGQLAAAVYADTLGVGEKRTEGTQEEPDEEIWDRVFDEEEDAIQRALWEGLEMRTESEHNSEVELSNVNQGDIIIPKQLNTKISECGEVVNPMDEEDYD